MADIVITASGVKAGANARRERGLAGVAVVAGKVGYRDPVTKKLLLADSNSVTVAAREGLGIFLNDAAVDQPVEIQFDGDITLNGLTAGATYFLSDTPGGICPDADVGTGEYVCLLGVAKSATVLALDIQFPNVAR